jgi:hypothetical protein
VIVHLRDRFNRDGCQLSGTENKLSKRSSLVVVSITDPIRFRFAQSVPVLLFFVLFTFLLSLACVETFGVDPFPLLGSAELAQTEQIDNCNAVKQNNPWQRRELDPQPAHVTKRTEKKGKREEENRLTRTASSPLLPQSRHDQARCCSLGGPALASSAS